MRRRTASVDRRRDDFKKEASKFKPAVVMPPGYSKARPAPLIVALHGSGGDGAEMARAWRAAAAKAGAVLVCPDAVRPLGSGYQWMFRDESRWLVLNTIEEARKKYAIDAARVYVVGFSQGANTAMELATTNPEAMAGVIAVAGHWEAHVQRLPVPGEAGAALPRFAVLVGSMDEAAPSNRELDAHLRKLGVPVLLRIYEGMGHGMPAARDRELTDAIMFVMEK